MGPPDDFHNSRASQGRSVGLARLAGSAGFAGFQPEPCTEQSAGSCRECTGEFRQALSSSSKTPPDPPLKVAPPNIPIFYFPCCSFSPKNLLLGPGAISSK